MHTKLKMEWEQITDTEQRCKVIGGWLVKSFEPVHHHETTHQGSGDGWDWRIAIAFIHDPAHEWEIIEPLGDT